MKEISGHQEFYPKKSVGKSRGRKVEVQDIRYYGYHQGFKVWIDGVKYPKARKEWYTTNNQQTAINQAFEESGITRKTHLTEY